MATNEKEYKSIKDWFYSEFKPRLPENKATLYDIPQSNRDFITKPGRKGISFQTLVSKISIGEDINNILPITNEISFCSLSVNSLLNSYELVLYSLMRVTGFNFNVVNYQPLEDIATTLCKDSDNTFCHSDVINYVTNSDDIFSYRYTMFYDIVESFCYFTTKVPINIINHDDTINTTLTEAKTTCTISIEPYNNLFTFQVMKYSWPTINKTYPLWHLQCNESKNVNIWKTSADNEANVFMCLTVDSEFHYIVTVNGKQCELDWLELPNFISNIQDFLLILQSLDELNVVNGISVTKFEDVLCSCI